MSQIRYAYTATTDSGRDLVYSGSVEFVVPEVARSEAAPVVAKEARYSFTIYDHTHYLGNGHPSYYGGRKAIAEQDRDLDGADVVEAVAIDGRLYEPIVLQNYVDGNHVSRIAGAAELGNADALFADVSWVRALHEYEGQGKTAKPMPAKTSTRFRKDPTMEALDEMRALVGGLVLVDGSLYREVVEPVYRIDKGSLAVVDAPDHPWSDGTFFRLSEFDAMSSVMAAIDPEHGAERARRMSDRVRLLDGAHLKADLAEMGIKKAARSLANNAAYHLHELPLPAMAAFADLSELAMSYSREENDDLAETLRSKMEEFHVEASKAHLRKLECTLSVARVNIDLFVARGAPSGEDIDLDAFAP